MIDRYQIELVEVRVTRDGFIKCYCEGAQVDAYDLVGWEMLDPESGALLRGMRIQFADDGGEMNHNSSGQPFLVADPHLGLVARAEQVYREAVADEQEKYERKRQQSNAFLAIGVVLILVSGYLGYLIGR